MPYKKSKAQIDIDTRYFTPEGYARNVAIPAVLIGDHELSAIQLRVLLFVLMAGPKGCQNTAPEIAQALQLDGRTTASAIDFLKKEAFVDVEPMGARTSLTLNHRRIRDYTEQSYIEHSEALASNPW